LQDKVDRAMQLVQLTGMAQRKPGQLSGGQQQRVALARALVFEPELVLMDEPLGALDKNLREHMQYEIKQIHRQLGVTIVYVTHDQSEAMTMSDRVAVFHAGRIEQLGEPRNLYDQPATDYIATFIGENNCFEGTIAAKPDRSGTVVQLAGGLDLPLLSSSPVQSGKCRALVRPEAVRIANAHPVQVTAKVVDLVYLGDHTRLIGQLRNGEQIIAKLRNDGLPDRAGIGTDVHLGWQTRDMLVFARAT
jgi:putative spermidine/putrescine transport system ATP-binding protein